MLEDYPFKSKISFADLFEIDNSKHLLSGTEVHHHSFCAALHGGQASHEEEISSFSEEVSRRAGY